MLRRISTKLNDLSLYKKFLLIVVVSICFSYGVFLISFRIMIRTYEQELYQTNAALLNHVSSPISADMDAIETISYNILTDSGIQEQLTLLADSPENSRLALVRRDLYESLYPYTFYNDYIESINLLLPDGTHICMGNSFDIQRFSIPSLEEKSDAAKGRVIWMPETHPGNYTVCGRQIRQIKFLKLNKLASLYIVIDLEGMITDCLIDAGYSPENAQFVLTDNGTRIYPEYAFHDEFCSRLAQESAGTQSSYRIESIDGQKNFITTGHIPRTGWQFLYFRDYHLIFSKIQSVKFFALALIICGGFITLFVIQLSFRHILRHLDYLVQKIRCFGSGRPLPYSESTYDYSTRADEIGQLHRSFDEMTKNVKLLKDENYDKQLLLQDATIKMLRQQINPHFLYNTLDTVNWLAQKYGAEDISAIARSLGQLFRSTISGQTDLIPLDEELAILNNYITIQKIRFKARLDFRLSVPDNASRILVPKLCIQPLVENALKYAMEYTDETCIIQVTVQEQEKDYVITVSNTGSQFEENLLWKIQNQEIIPQGSGVGLINIDSRLKLLYGTHYGLNIYNEDGMAVVMLSIPKKQERTHV